MERIDELIQKYIDNMDRQAELDESLFGECEKEKWILKLRSRAMAFEEINRENNTVIDTLKAALQKGLSADEMKMLYPSVKGMYDTAHDEGEIQIPVFKRIITYIEENMDLTDERFFIADDNPDLLNINILISLYYYCYIENETVKKPALGQHECDETYAEKVLAMRTYYARLRHNSRMVFWSMWFNYSIACLEGEHPDPDLSCKRIQEMMAFWESPEVQELDRADEELITNVESMKREWLGVREHIDLAGEATKAYFCDLADEYFEAECRSVENRAEYDNEVYASYLEACAIRQERSYEDVLREYIDYYVEGCRKITGKKNTELEEFYFVTNAPMTIERWCRHIADDAFKRSVIGILLNNTKNSWYKQSMKGMDAIINSMLRSWCFTMLKYIPSSEEKTDWLVELVVRRQLPTYLHSAMVSRISTAIAKYLLDHQPSYFADLPSSERDNVLSYIGVAALLHDIGKAEITGVITKQGRRLSDEEFGAIKRHPEYGYEMLAEDAELKCYADVALYHHKFYNGIGGYPQGNEVLSSPYKLIIDIITIADCLDAATDNLGRNYKFGKSFAQVMEEFKQDKGSRYSPAVIDAIEDSDDLQKKLTYIVGEGRIDLMYHAFSQSVASERADED